MVALRRTSVILLASMLVLGMCGGLADAAKRHKKRGFATRITLTHPAENQFTGRVTSKLKGCRKQRLVNVFYIDPYTGETQPVSVQRTKKSGNYRVDLSHPAYGGTYQAVAPKVKKRGRLLCRAGRSNQVTVPLAPLVP